MYKDLKVTSGEVAANNVKSAPDRLQGTATENKNVFDKLVELFVAKYNDLLDELDDNEIKAVDPITINGYTISHANSGVTQGMYGTDQEQDPQHGEKFIVPYIIVDEHGHIVSAGNSEVQLPSGGGGGGTDNYNDLTDKPSINSVTLSGNKTSSDLSLASATHSHTKSEITDFPALATVATTGDYDDLSDKPSIPTKTSDLTNDSGFITGYTETDPVFSASAAHGITSSDISDWNNKSDFSGSYNDLTNKPTIPSKTSDLTNDSGYITGYTETDPVFSASASSGITSSDIINWNSAVRVAAQAVIDAAAASSAAAAAQSSADNASEYAARALGNLSTVQSVAETLTWITAHGTMALTTDVTPDPTHVYFVVDAGGDYTVGGVTYAIVTEPVTADMNTYYELSIDESLNNYVATHLSVTSEGLWIIPDAGGNKVLIATGSGSTYTAAGTYIVGANNVVLAKFLASGTTIGAESGAHTTLDADGQTVYKDSMNAIAHIGVGSFPDPDDPDTPIRGSYYTLGERTGQIGIGSLAHGDGTEASGDYSVSMGVGCIASGEGAVAIGEFSRATGQFSFAHGIDDDGYALASGHGSHAEGTSIASGNMAHSEGRGAKAIGNYSHAQNCYTVANNLAQTAIGKYNDNQANTAFEIGNGTAETARSNALTVDWSGNVEADGDITDGSGNVLANKADTSAVPTKTSDLTNDSGFITTETDPTVPSWAKASTKPTYTASEVGALPNTTTIPTKTSDLTNDRHFVAKGDFVISSHTTTNKTISGGSTMSAETQTFTKSGYYPLAISGWVLNGSNATNLTLVHLYISSQASGSVGVTYRIHNAGSSQSTNTNVKVYILWIKEN